MILKIIAFLFVFHTLLFADTSHESIQINSSEVVKVNNNMVKEEVDVSFDRKSVLFMLVLTSLLGTFFLKDELSDSF